MSKAAEVTAPKPMSRVLAGVDALFCIAVSIIMIAVGIAIGIQ